MRAERRTTPSRSGTACLSRSRCASVSRCLRSALPQLLLHAYWCDAATESMHDIVRVATFKTGIRIHCKLLIQVSRCVHASMRCSRAKGLRGSSRSGIARAGAARRRLHNTVLVWHRSREWLLLRGHATPPFARARYAAGNARCACYRCMRAGVMPPTSQCMPVSGYRCHGDVCAANRGLASPVRVLCIEWRTRPSRSNTACSCGEDSPRFLSCGRATLLAMRVAPIVATCVLG